MTKKELSKVTYKGPFVISSVYSETGEPYAQERKTRGGNSFPEPRFYFKLMCGHESEAKSRKHWSGRIVASPEKSDYRPCVTCTEKLVAEGKPIPPCGLCKGKKEVEVTKRVDGPRGASISWSRYRCPACHGKSAPPLETVKK